MWTPYFRNPSELLSKKSMCYLALLFDTLTKHGKTCSTVYIEGILYFLSNLIKTTNTCKVYWF